MAARPRTATRKAPKAKAPAIPNLSGHILLIGAGRMGSALVRAWLEKGLGPKLIAADPKMPEALAAAIESKGGRVIAGPRALKGAEIDVAVIAVKPQVLAEAVVPYTKALRGAVTVSIAAGMRLATLGAILGLDAAIIRAMPNLLAELGLSPTGAIASPGVTPAQWRLGTSLLDMVGGVFPVASEDQLDLVTAVSGSGPAYVFLLAECLAQAARDNGMADDLAKGLAQATVAGSGMLLGQAQSDAAALRDSVTSPGGTTEAALKILMDAKKGLQPLLTRAVAAAQARAKALSR